MIFKQSTLIYTLAALLTLNSCTKSPEPTTEPEVNTAPVIDDVYKGVNSLIASVSDNEQPKNELTYLWHVGDESYTDSVVYLTNPQGVVYFELVVNDGQLDSNTYYGSFDFGTVDLPTVLNADFTPSVFSGQAPLSVTFDSSTSTAVNGEIAQYAWDFESDGVVDFYGPLPTKDFADIGEYNVTLTIQTSDGSVKNSTTKQITVLAPDQIAPIAVASADNYTVETQQQVNFSGASSTDEDGSILNYSWSVEGTNTVLLGSRVAHSFDQAGEYDVTLIVTDNDSNNSAPSTVKIVVVEPNQAPEAVASVDETSITAPATVTFDASGSSDDTLISDYKWTVNGEELSGISPTYTFPEGTSGDFIAYLQVTDEEGLSDVDQVTISVAVPNGAPTAVASANVESGNTPLTVTFDASGSTDDGGYENLSFRWTIDGLQFTTENPSYTFTTDNDHVVQLVVTDADNVSNSTTITISTQTVIVNEAPTAIIVAPVTSGETPLTITLNGASSIDDVGIESYLWENGANTSSSSQVSYTFNTAGTYPISLTVTDAEGESDTETVNIVVRAPGLDYDGSLPVPQDLVDQAIQDSLQSGELISGNVIYTKIPDGESPLDYPPPRVITIDENGNVVEYELPAHHVFDFGDDDYIVLDDFNDNDHQNNLGGAVAINYCENYTEGGGYWYVFGDDATSIENASGLAINAYNIIEAVDNYELHVEFQVSEYAGVGTNILFEEHDVDLSNLDYIEITVKGSGEYVPMLEPLAENKPDWGNYAAYNGALGETYSLSNSYQVIRLEASDFVGEQFSNIEGGSFEADGKHATKFFFQSKTPGRWDMYIDRIEFFGTGLNVDSMEWKNDEYDADCEGADVENQDVPTLIPSPYIDFATATITDAGTQMQADEKTNAELTPNGTNNWLHVGTGAGTDARRLYDSNGDMVRLTGVNWFGFETKNLIPMGIWEDGRTYEEMLDHMKELGFNTVRIPFSDEVISRSRSTGEDALVLGDLDIDLTANGLNATDTPLDLMDAIIEYADDIGLKVVLDSHSRASDRYLVEGHWVSEFGTEAEWIETWEFLTDRYKDQDAVAAMDLNNEPHFEAAWGSADPAMNWNEAAERAGDAIQAINPNVLIIVEGVEHLNGHQELDDAQKALDSYWWGGNLKGVRDYPINLAVDNSKLVYSPHEYGPEVYVQPWFKDSSFPRNLQYIWEDRFGYVYNESLGHMFVGEFGIKNDIANSASNKWFETFVDYICDRSEGFSWTFWAWNPNSGDTGGVLGNDWETVNTWKMDYLESCLAPMIGNDNG